MKKHASAGWVFWVAVCLAFSVYHSAFSGDVPAIINYQGKLTDNMGNAVTSGYYEIEFRIWDHPTATGAGSLIWGRSFPLHVMDDGIFNILLSNDGGAITNPVSPAVSDLAEAFEGEDRYPGLTVTRNPGGAVPSPAEISPRQRLVSAPFAFHAQNASWAATATLATNANDATKLGGLGATQYVVKSEFPALSDNPESILKWAPGPTATKSAIYEYDGKYLLTAGTPSEPAAGVALEVRGGVIKAVQGIEVNAAITPSVGTAGHGVQFPANPGGGADDGAWITYAVRTGEDCSLQLGISNDPGDNLELRASGDIELYGKVRAMGGVTRIKTWDNGSSVGHIDGTADTDGFLVVDVHAARVRVEIAGVINVENRSIDDDDDNYGSHMYPVAKGEYWKVTYEENLPDDSTFVAVYWRPLGL